MTNKQRQIRRRQVRASRANSDARSLFLCAPVGELVAATNNATDGEASPRRFQMVAYTGGAMRLGGFEHPVVVDLAGMKVSAKARPILNDHNPSLIVGHTEAVTVDGANLKVNGVISGGGAVAQEIVKSSLAGFPWQASIGASVHKIETINAGKTGKANGQEFAGPVHIVRQSRLGEVSFVALGADDNTSARVAAGEKTWRESDMNFEAWLNANGFEDVEALSDAQRDSLRAMFDAQNTQEEETASVVATATEGGDDSQPSVIARIDAGGVVSDMRAEAAAESQRIASIRGLCGDAHETIEADAIANGWDTTRTELEILRADRPQINNVRTGRAAQPPQAIEASLCLSAGFSEDQVGEMYDDRTVDAAVSREMRGAGIQTLVYETIRAAGGSARPGRMDNETIRSSFIADQQLLQAAGGGGFSTISLTGILSSVANKTLLAAYQAVPSVASEIASVGNLVDFKQVTHYRMTGVGTFSKIGPGGEIKSSGLSEQGFTNRLDTYAQMITLTRQMIINDDLGAFLEIPRIMGRGYALALERALFEELLDNGGSFFSVGNSNLLTGASSALSIDGLTKAEQVFLDQTDSQGQPILLNPSRLLVPTGLKVTAEQLMGETRVNETTTANKPKLANNPHAGKFTAVASTYLNAQSLAGGSATAWYLFADPADISAIEVAYLRGKRVPTIESGSTDFNTLGTQFRAWHDFGVSLQDPNAAVKSAGV